jgi:hypothetical protein
MPRSNQLAQQWRLLQLIDRPVGVVVDQAAGELACTIRRDLQVLHDAGFPIYDDPMVDGRCGIAPGAASVRVWVVMSRERRPTSEAPAAAGPRRALMSTTLSTTLWRSAE